MCLFKHESQLFRCCPRQDVPNAVIRDPPACDEVFDKIGRDRVLPRIAAKVDTPLTTSEYDSLHDPHVRHLYLRNKSLRQHLIRNGLVGCVCLLEGSRVSVC